jgi:hypothetical protein
MMFENLLSYSRSVRRFKFLAVVDLDEFILPRRSKNLASYLTEMSNSRPQVITITNEKEMFDLEPYNVYT